MSQLIAHANAITRHREHAQVNTAMMYSLLDLLSGPGKLLRITLYNVITLPTGRTELALAAWNEGRAVHSEDRECPPEILHPELLQALESQIMAVRVPDRPRGRHRCWLPAVYDREPLACIEIESSRAITHRQLIAIGGIISLYTNYLSLLTYSQIDTLTQLLNRKTFDDSLHRILAAHASDSGLVEKERRGGEDAGDDWLAVIDIDHFKQVNDRFGHLFGDEVLILMADTMRKTFRRRDKLFRFGGEEFVVVLRHVGEQRARQIFERFRETVAAREFPQVGHVTVSLGFTRIQSFDNPTNLLGRADEALYYAKRHGRNQVRNYEDLVAEGHVTPQTMNTEADLF